ncbi:cyclophilin-like fold protein [Actinomyces sp. MRS3W]|uniref:cyclophilin-like fold protein n=1 Tax=Actinomyces sp. MRS3W TaxID=2800796 RepID=UPI0028FD08EB|nr:cyclophilin-like fold protein [Actinomyces sp. MRS3W]MDU0348108.1 cyclophilin-like fold protein [Actinomyces sp. MRS3W]
MHPTSRRRLLRGLSLAAVGPTLAACASRTGTTASTSPTSATGPTSTPSSGGSSGTATAQSSPHATTNPTQEASMPATQPASIRIAFGGALDNTVLEATLTDNAATRSLLAQLPLEVSFSDYGGQELTASLPQDLDTTGLTASAPQVGDIAWYEPNHVLVLYYTSIGSWPGLYVIGHVDGDVSALAGQDSDLPASLTVSE